MSLTGEKVKSSSFSSTSRGIEAGPFIRYYFHFGKIAVFPTLSASWGKSHIYTKYNPGFGLSENEYDMKVSKYQGGAGVAWFIANNVALDGILYYQYQDSSPGTTNETKTVAFSLGLQFFIPAKGTQLNE